MLTLDLNQAIGILKKNFGYCLWVGAGVTSNLSSAGKIASPGWESLVSIMEVEAGLTKPTIDQDFPTRLEACKERLGHENFQHCLRKTIVGKLCQSIVQAAESSTSERPLPIQVRQLAHLGSLANPIINFNIETLTSELTASPGGPFSIKCFAPPLPETGTRLHHGQGGSDGKRFCRSVFHPHGSITASGVCVLTAREYRSLKGTLALQLATHSAFQSQLAIVGMSLDDQYLRDQLSEFRNQIDGIYWFVRNAGRLAGWAEEARITVVPVDNWDAFWAAVSANLPAPPEAELLNAWMSVVAKAGSEYYHSCGEISRTISQLRKMGATNSGLEHWLQLARNRGETGSCECDETKIHIEAQRLVIPILKALHRITS